MKKLILMSILIATFALPFWATTRHVSPRRTVKGLRKYFVVFCVVYVIAVCYVIPRL